MKYETQMCKTPPRAWDSSKNQTVAGHFCPFPKEETQTAPTAQKGWQASSCAPSFPSTTLNAFSSHSSGSCESFR